MLRSKQAEETEDESSGWMDRVRGSSAESTEDESGSWFDRARAKYGIGALLVAAGVVLFLIPEPATSTVGLALIGVGALIWIVSWFRERSPSSGSDTP